MDNETAKVINTECHQDKHRTNKPSIQKIENVKH